MIIMVVSRFDDSPVLDSDDNIRSHHSADDNNGCIMIKTIERNIRLFTILMIHYNEFRNEVIAFQN